MKLTFDVKQDLRKFLAIGGVSLALIVGMTSQAMAGPARDSDRDGLSNKIEKRVTHTSPFDKDSDNDRIKDGNEDEDQDRIDNTNELKDRNPGTDINDEDTDNDGLEDGDEDDDDEDDDCDGDEDEDDDDDDE